MKDELAISVHENYLIVTPSADTHSGVADFATSGAIPLLTLFAGPMRIAKDKLANANEAASDSGMQRAFDSKAMLWGKVQGAQVWEYCQRKFFGMKTPSKIALRCDLYSPNGAVPFLIPLVRSQDTLVQDPVRAIGCPLIVKLADIREKDMLGVFNDAMRRFYTQEWCEEPFQ
ncbi:hypothetical protein [Thermomonas aquatica]|uniref:Uncharacterized protein n=1 Tax=Thermomonas aquatica TaxID=2202149 RepID=A0A5B7ZMA5_9GAMM|nr:hypothetical protein [Thermomonas aquatica]QDA56017.1 hypothetical protein FHQ07_01120 [Thermomonas aquatica]